MYAGGYDHRLLRPNYRKVGSDQEQYSDIEGLQTACSHRVWMFLGYNVKSESPHKYQINTAARHDCRFVATHHESAKLPTFLQFLHPLGTSRVYFKLHKPPRPVWSYQEVRQVGAP